MEDAQTLSRAELTSELEGVPEAFGPNALVAVIKGAVHDDKVESVSMVVRKAVQAVLTFVGM